MPEFEVFDDSDDRYIVWLNNNPHGFVLNVSRDNKTYLVRMHRAVCGRARDERNEHGGLTERGYIKVGALREEPLHEWHATHRPRAALLRCKFCLKGVGEPV